ncbi:hypothetical protein DL770_002957 [Monosporascus sp. CRB-9-2]|nr:hypothetical protein DL770_002957 [Monosporascus sp. CRB-9-2]
MSDLLSYLVENEPSFRRARLPALYSDFRSQRTLNPDGFTANVSAWKRGLSSAALAGLAPSKSAMRNHFTIELDDALLRALESKQFGRPLALGTAIHEAVGSGELLPLEKFLNIKQSVYYKGWGSIPWSVMAWGLRQAGLERGIGGLLGSWGEDKIPKGQFVVLHNLEVAAKAFSDAIADRTSPFERTFSKTHFRRTFEGSLLSDKKQRLSETDVDVLVKFLSRDKAIIATDGHTIRIRTSEAESATITEEDSAIASLKELMEDLTRQTQVLSRRVDELNEVAQDAVRRKNRVSALAALKSRKLAEANFAQRHATLSQLEEVAAKIQQAADNVQMVRTMQASTAALRSLNAAVGGADRVDAVLDVLREQMGEVDEVGNVIAEAGQAPAVVDEAEVDDEFEAMLAEERKKEEEAERAKKEAKDAEETRRKLAELQNLGPVPAGLSGQAQTTEEGQKGENRPSTPATAAAEALGGLSLDGPGADNKAERLTS